jgi:hypothetical protein
LGADALHVFPVGMMGKKRIVVTCGASACHPFVKSWSHIGDN